MAEEIEEQLRQRREDGLPEELERAEEQLRDQFEDQLPELIDPNLSPLATNGRSNSPNGSWKR